MQLITFIFGAIIISLSGVMAPGPMTAVTIGKGNESPHAGVMIAIGHGIIEFPLMAFIFFGFGYLFNINYVKSVIMFIGGIILFLLALSMLNNFKKNQEVFSNNNQKSSLLTGILLSAGNPYFLLWWVFIGAPIILQSYKFGISGLVLFAVIHWLCDFVWLYFLSSMSFFGGKFFGNIFQKVVFLICSIFLLFFSGKFIFDAVRTFIYQL
jgi:threonine/homoserine/homoserine lactone efflux protein